jgi:hypothetical protein
MHKQKRPQRKSRITENFLKKRMQLLSSHASHNLKAEEYICPDSVALCSSGTPAAITAAFILPDEQVIEQVAIEKQPQSYFDKFKGSVKQVWSRVEEDAVTFGENALDNAINATTDASKETAAKFESHHSRMAFDVFPPVRQYERLINRPLPLINRPPD